MPKEDCKYWDKCYQRNEHHLQKYNHPAKEQQQQQAEAKVKTQEEEEATATVTANGEKRAPKRCSARTEDGENIVGQGETSISAERKENGNVDQGVAMNGGKKESTSSTSGEETKERASDIDRPEIDTESLRAEALRNIAGKDYMHVLQKRIKISVQSEYDDLLLTNEFIRHKFLVEMPPDFYAFWKFIGELKKDVTGAEIIAHVNKQFNLQLVGAFEYLGGKFHNAVIREPGDYLRHWRFFYDPPEFQTVFVRRDTGIHYGYWRDTPQDKDGLMVARNNSKQDCEFEFIAGNIFDAFLYYLEKDFPSTPFSANVVATTKKAVQQFISTNEVKLESLEKLRKARNAKVVAMTFHRAGIVVPFDGETQIGYRPLLVSDLELKRIIKLFERAADKTGKSCDAVKTAVFEQLQPVATAASIALDECDFGTSLELGIDLFCSGRTELHMLAQSILVPAYSMLNRPQFIAISKAHMEKRSRELKLSIFDLDK